MLSKVLFFQHLLRAFVHVKVVLAGHDLGEVDAQGGATVSSSQGVVLQGCVRVQIEQLQPFHQRSYVRSTRRDTTDFSLRAKEYSGPLFWQPWPCATDTEHIQTCGTRFQHLIVHIRKTFWPPWLIGAETYDRTWGCEICCPTILTLCN